MKKSVEKQYPQPEKGEPWTSITEESLKEKGFHQYNDIFYHPKLVGIGVVKGEHAWEIWAYRPTVKDMKDSLNRNFLRYVKYMYQVDNMFHGFTDRWLGLI